MTSPEKTVLIIEDEPDAAELFAEMMRVSGFRVQKTSSSAPAINMMTAEKPDVVLLDIMMPEVSGLEIPLEIRQAVCQATADLQKGIGSLIRWVPLENMHLTLIFLGDIAPSNVTILRLRGAEAPLRSGRLAMTSINRGDIWTHSNLHIKSLTPWRTKRAKISCFSTSKTSHPLLIIS